MILRLHPASPIHPVSPIHPPPLLRRSELLVRWAFDFNVLTRIHWLPRQRHPLLHKEHPQRRLLQNRRFQQQFQARRSHLVISVLHPLCQHYPSQPLQEQRLQQGSLPIEGI